MLTKICDLPKKELGDLIRINFFKIGVNPQPTKEELDTFINDIYKNHSGKTDELLTEAFDALSAGDIELKKIGFSPYFLNRLIKTYTAQKANSNQPKSKDFVTPKSTNEEKWKAFFKHFTFYKSLPGNPDWIALFNYCVAKEWIIDTQAIKVYSRKACIVAEKDVKNFVMANWAEYISN